LRNGRVGRTRTSKHLRPRQVGYRLPYDPKNLRLAGYAGFEPADLGADNAARTLALSYPLRVVGSRGFEPRSARSERAASANCATSR
jgi:hypothetical protein